MIDERGLPLSTDSAPAAAAFERALLGYLMQRVDTMAHLERALQEDPGLGLAHCLKGCLLMLTFKRANLPAARDCARLAREACATSSMRERMHVDALDAWIDGDIDRALGVWEAILDVHPTDLLAMRLVHFHAFWLGRPGAMRESIDRLLPHWGAELPGFGLLQGCVAFACEEAGDYARAEPAARLALEIDAQDAWAAHALAHVMVMQQRHGEGIDFLERQQVHWEGTGNLVHHLWWHRAVFHYARREFDEVLALYDHRFRDLSAPLTRAQPDLYIDVQNAASMLFRLELAGVPVGSRWEELADKAQARIGDCLSAFTLPHWAMAFAATGRDASARAMLEAMREFGRGRGTVAPIVARVAVPVCEAVLAHRRGEHARVLQLMRPVMAELHSLGGSHAQQEVLHAMYRDASARAGPSPAQEYT